MGRDPRITQYIQKSRPFARPILRYLRDVVHAACPAVEERMKWSFPHFDYEGKMMCSMAAFNEHAAFGFWYAPRMKDPRNVMETTGRNTAMGHFGRIRDISDLPKKSVLMAYVREAARLNEAQATPPRTAASAPKRRTAPPRPPTYFLAALKRNARAYAAYRSFPPGQKKEYVSWITEAKTDATREKRMRTAVKWMAEGKYRNWKYMPNRRR